MSANVRVTFSLEVNSSEVLLCSQGYIFYQKHIQLIVLPTYNDLLDLE